MKLKQTLEVSQLKDISVFDEEFTSQYGKGTVIETNITAIIQPSQIVTVFYEGFTGRLSVLDISWCLPEGEEKLRNSKVGDRIKCVVLSIDFQNKQVMLSQKHLTKPLSDTIKWERIERGDEFQADIIDELNDTLLVKTTKGLYGLIHKSLLKLPFESLKVKVNTKLDYSDLLSFVPASLEIANVISVNEEQTNEFSFIEEDLQSFYKFKRSLLGINASDEICEIIQRGFDADERIFSKEITTPYPLYIQFELNSSIYESIFKQQAIPFFYEGATYSEESERALLEKLAKESYWFKINKRGNRYRENGSGSNNEDVIDFSLFNEQLNFFGEVQISKDKKEYRFLIRNFSFGHTVATASEAKKKNAKYGSFLFSNQLKVLSPFGTLPFGTSQKDFFDFVVLKTQCFETINSLKLDAGEILKQEGRTLAIIDKFLEYQMSLIDEKKENTVLVDKFERIPGQTGGVSIKLPITVANSLEFEEETVVNLRLKKGDELLKLTDGLLTYYQDGCKIVFNKEVNLELLKDGFYIDKRISKRQFQIQREIIQDFLEKKIKIDHIESLLVNPDTIRTPVLANVIFNNPDLQRTEKEQSDNNQVKAVKKAVGNQNIFLIQGPPGTGKTTVIAEIIQQLVAKGEKILVAGQNHVAVDNVLEKIAKIHNLNLLRVGNPERIDKELVQYNIDNLVEDYKVDYAAFVNNQLLLSKKYVELKTSNDGALLESFNKAVNEVSSKYGKLKDVYKERHFILRDGLNELSPKEINEAILSLAKWIESGKNEYEILLRPLIYNSVDVVFATCIGIKTDQIFRNTNFKFDTVIIDEAGKANIAETLVAIELGKKVILVGDQMQLPPYMDSSLIDEREAGSFPKSTYGSNFLQEEIIHALKTSFFEFIINRINAGRFPTENKEMLNYQHRMHPHIGEFVSESFYNGLVQMGSRTHLNRIDMPTPFNKEVVFFDTSNSENPFEQNDGYSAKNNTEAEAISEIILPRLFEHNISPSSIAIIAPYKSQVANIQHFIRNSSLCNFKNIDISTLDSFQGKEYDIILFSFTRSVDHKKAPTINGRKKFSKVGFLDDARRLNVAFSRAKKKLILVGNAVTLTDHKSHYDGLFNYTQLFKKLVQLSNKATIGNFVNIADLHDFKPPFEIFTERHKNGDIVTGQVKMIGRNAKGIFGLFIRIDRVDCLLPWSFMPQDFKAKLESISQGSDIVIVIFDINESNQKITVKLASFWEANIPKLKPTGRYKGIVKNKVQFGYFILLECGLEGLLHRSQLRRNQQFQEGQSLEVIVLKIDNDKKQIDLGI